MTVSHVIRRTHLYLGAAFLPWFVMFAVSSFVFNHPGLQGSAPVQWRVLVDRAYDLPVPSDPDLRAIGARILADAGLSSTTGFGVGRPNANRINVNLPSFTRPIRVSYFIGDRRLLAEQREAAWAPVLTGLHARNGYLLHSPWQTLWALIVGLVCVALVLWVITGIYMWWLLPSARVWGWITLACGVTSFVALMMAL